eukprot:15464231-Alexandrium_andersonii.AAC.1
MSCPGPSLEGRSPSSPPRAQAALSAARNLQTSEPPLVRGRHRRRRTKRSASGAQIWLMGLQIPSCGEGRFG